MLRTLAAGFLVLLPSLESAGQTPSFQFEALTVEHGLSQSSVWSIIQDKYGFMWFGTADGLNKYDGYSFQVFRHNPQDSTSLSNNTAWTVLEDRTGALWIGTAKGLHRYDRQTGRFTRLANEERYKNTQLKTRITSIIQDSTGLIWIGSITGIWTLDPIKGSVQELFPFDTVGASEYVYTKVLYAENDNVWCSSRSQLVRFDIQSKRFVDVTIPVNKTRSPLMFMHKDRKGIYWIGTIGGGLISWNRQQDQWHIYLHDPKNPASIIDDRLRSVAEDEEGRLWIGTGYSGVNIFDRDRAAFTRFAPAQNGRNDARYEGVSEIYRDKSGLMWVGYDGAGILKVNPHKRKFNHVLLPPSGAKATGDNFFKSVMVDHRGIVWLGTYDQGIVSLDRRTGSVGRFLNNVSDKTAVTGSAVFSLLEDHAGRIWGGTSSGLYEYDRSTNRFQRHMLSSIPSGSVRGNYVISLYEDSSDILWVGTSTQLARYDGKTSTQVLTLQVQDSSRLEAAIQCIAPGGNGRLWIGTAGRGLIGLGREGRIEHEFRNDATDRNSLCNNSVKTIYLDPEGVLWVGTEGGLNRVDPASGKWKSYHVDEGLPNEFIYGILMDSQRNLWISTNRGLSRMSTTDPDHPTFRNYTPDDGLQSFEFNTNVYFKAEDGEMFFGGVNGFNSFYPDSVRDNPIVPSMAFTGFKKFDLPFSLGGEMETVKEIVLDYTETVFSFEFAALEFTSPAQNHYAYIMEGIDKDWVYSGNRREARYTHLDPGKYVFKVKGSNNDGVWNEAGASISIVVLPPWWQTWWAYTGYIIAFVGLGFGTRWLVQNWKIMVASRKARYVSHYRLHEELGRGGMGTVYKATDVNTKQVVAIKLLHPDLLKDPENRKRLMAEGQLLSSFNHSNILKVNEVGETGERGFIAMEYLTGGTLREHLQKNFPLPFDEVKRFALEVACGLKEIHEHGVIHRDLKTGNVMLDDQLNVRIMDFGLSKSPLVTTMTTLGSVIGTLGYVAPEQVTNVNVDQRVDIFSFGVVLYELLTNSLPFKGENEIAVIHSIFNTVPPPPSSLQPGVPQWMDEVVMRCLAKEPRERYASVSGIIGAIQGHS
jgi:ligand-binding sensor domain-containing protein/predicted Ser/Thr protein kinase